MFLCLVAKASLADSVDAYARELLKKQHVVGLSLAVVKDGRIVKVGGYGFANIETKTPARPGTVYKIASVSKQFFASAVMLLVGEGKIRLDDKASQYLDKTPDSWKDITVRELLSHTAGLVEDPPGFLPFKPQEDAEVIKSVYPVPLLFKPGTAWSYSNAGYFAVAEVIRKVTGQSWDTFLADRLFRPAGLLTTRITSTTEIVPNRSAGYLFDADRLVNAENWVAVRPSGAFLSTVVDLAKWDIALDKGTILPPVLRDQLWTRTKFSTSGAAEYGLGWEVGQWQGHTEIGHSGGLPGFVTKICRYPDDGLAVIVCANTESCDVGGAARHIAGLFVPALAAPEEKPIEDKSPETTSRVFHLLQATLTGTLPPDEFVAWRRDTDIRMAKFNAMLLKPYGSLKKLNLVGGGKRSTFVFYRYRAIFDKDSCFIMFAIDDAGKVIDLSVQLMTP